MRIPGPGICALVDLPGKDKEKRRGFDRCSNHFLKKTRKNHNGLIQHAGRATHDRMLHLMIILTLPRMLKED